jgi:hypothetical protein
MWYMDESRWIAFVDYEGESIARLEQLRHDGITVRNAMARG